MTFTSPAATTAKMPLAPTWLATRYTMKGGEHLEQHVERGVLQAPGAHLAHDEVAQVAQRYADENASQKREQELDGCVDQRERAGNGCASANWKATMPDASLMSDSPSRMLLARGEMSVSLESEATATASVGPRAALAVPGTFPEHPGRGRAGRRVRPADQGTASGECARRRREEQQAAIDAAVKKAVEDERARTKGRWRPSLPGRG